jgi:hypothetical protein
MKEGTTRSKMEENISLIQRSDEGLLSGIYKEPVQVNNRKRKQSN